MREGRAARHAASIQDFIIASYRIDPVIGAYAEMMSETLIWLNICGTNGSVPQMCRLLRGGFTATATGWAFVAAWTARLALWFGFASFGRTAFGWTAALTAGTTTAPTATAARRLRSIPM